MPLEDQDPMDTSSSAPPTSGTDPVQSTGTPSNAPPTPTNDDLGTALSLADTLKAKSAAGELQTPKVEEQPAAAPSGAQPIPPSPAAAPGAAADQDPYSIPNFLRGEPRRVYVEAVNRLKESDAKLEKAEGIIENFRNHVAEVGATPQQVQAAFGYLGLINKGNFEEALKLIDAQRAEIARAAGIKLPGVDFDPLSEFPELAAKVDNLELTEEAALELAAVRREKQKLEQEQASRAQQTEQIQKQQAFREAKFGELNALLDEWGKSDIDYPALDEHIAAFIEGGFLQNTPPQLWTNALKTYYTSLKTQLSKVGGRNGITPLRPGSTGGDMQPEPKTMGDAIRAGLKLG